jgi:phosphohistidine phosphatase SixA
VRWLRCLMLVAIGGVMVLTACQGEQQTVVVTPPPAKATGAPSPAAAAASPSLAAAAPPAPATSPTASPAAAVSPAVPAVASPAASPAPVVAAPTPSSAACQIVLGMATMRDLVGPATVGECVEDERQNPGNGNAEQRTTNGMLVYRWLDGRLLFSNGDRTWVNGPNGLVDRPNDQRFGWEGDRQMAEALRGGGHIVYFQHGPTDPAQRDADPNNLANCATQRNLTEAGRAQAQEIGEAFRTLNIPVGPVLSSEYCRAQEYARLAFDKAEVAPGLVLPDPLTEEQKAQNTEALKDLLATPPPVGTNTVMVAHSPNIRLAAGVDLPVEGGAAVFRVGRGGAPTLVAGVLPGEWTALAQALGPR